MLGIATDFKYNFFMEKKPWEEFDRLAREAGWEWIGYGPPEDDPLAVGQDGFCLCSGIDTYKKGDQYADSYWINEHIVYPARIKQDKQESNK
jgi:hypothetical protein